MRDSRVRIHHNKRIAVALTPYAQNHFHFLYARRFCAGAEFTDKCGLSAIYLYRRKDEAVG
jgi:hypothetical protein